MLPVKWETHARPAVSARAGMRARPSSRMSSEAPSPFVTRAAVSRFHLRRADKRSSAIATELARASHVILANQRALDPGRRLKAFSCEFPLLPLRRRKPRHAREKLRKGADLGIAEDLREAADAHARVAQKLARHLETRFVHHLSERETVVRNDR